MYICIVMVVTLFSLMAYQICLPKSQKQEHILGHDPVALNEKNPHSWNTDNIWSVRITSI